MSAGQANYGQSSHGLRGDYSRMRPDYTVDQDYSAYTEDQQDRWRRLYQRQIELVRGRACDEYLNALLSLPYEKGIPRFEEVNAPLGAATSWQLVAVPGLVPDLVFFDHLANRRFPVTWWIREEHEFSYIVEPDVFHDFFGHVPMLFTPQFADYMQAYGRGGVKAEGLGALQWLWAELTGHPPQITHREVGVFKEHWAYSSAKAQAELGYTVTPLEEGLRRTLVWLRERGLVS